MLEIILVIGLCKALGNVLRAKGRKPFWMQVLLGVAWLGGEIAGAILGGIVHVVRNGPNEQFGVEVYLFAIVGAALGASVTFFIAYMMPSLKDDYVQQVSAVTDPFDRHIDPSNPYAR